MVAFFDTSVHIPLLRGTLQLAAALREVEDLPVRLSPVVASELLRGVSERGRRVVDKLIDQLLPLEPPSWRRSWIEVGRLLPRIFPQHEIIGLGRLQNDCLLALSARDTGAVLLTADQHFADIRRHVPFRLKILAARTYSYKVPAPL